MTFTVALVALLRSHQALATSESLPPFFDYDCALVSTTDDAAGDWGAVYEWVLRDIMRENVSESVFALPDEFLPLVDGPLTVQVEAECPLGLLFLAILHFYKKIGEGMRNDDLLPFANRIHQLLQKFEAYEIALSRWPVFAVLEHFAPTHEKRPELYCDGEHGVLDWGELRHLGNYWAEVRRNQADDPIVEEMEYKISDMFFKVLRKVDNQNAAQEECMWGFYFLVASQVVAAANRETHHLPNFNSIINEFLVSQPFPKIAGSGWPIFTVLVIFADLNKGVWFFKGDRKYLRSYSDWDLRSDELSPLVSAEKPFLSPGWRAEVAAGVDAFARLGPESYAQEVAVRMAKREANGGPLRPIVRSLLEAAVAIAAASRDRSKPRLAYFVLLYGDSWARLLERMARRMRQLAMTQPLFVVAIGEAAAEACRQLARQTAQEPFARVVCWSPNSQSQVHRFVAMNMLLHLGIDFIYMDMDTFLLRDPTPRLLAQAEGLDALFGSHADADCINIGVFYIKATPSTAIWLSQFVAWYHDHPYEVDQRGLHVFLRLPSKNLKVAYPPEDLVPIRGARMEDVNEVVIFDVGWHGKIEDMLIMHWCHRPLALKETEINQAYDAGDAADIYGVPLAVLLSSVIGAPPDTPLSAVLTLKVILEMYRKSEPPLRDPCW